MHEQTKIVWDEILNQLNIREHDFSSPFYVEHKIIKKISSKFKDFDNNKKEIRILGSMTQREKRHTFFIENNIFLLPASNTEWVFIRGDGYFDPKYKIDSEAKQIKSEYELDTIFGQSEGRYIHQIYAQGILDDFTNVKKPNFTVSGRRRANFKYNAYGHDLECKGAQIEVDAGFESENEVILIEAKTGEVGSEIIRQIYFPYKCISGLTKKNIRNIFMVVSKDRKMVSLFEYIFEDSMVYESIKLVNSEKYFI